MGSEHSNERGSVLMWVIGSAAVGLLVVTATAQIVSVMHQRRALQYATDRAALAAANQLELAAFMDSGRLSDVDIAQSSALAAAADSLATEAFLVRIEELECVDRVIRLRTSRRITSTLGWGLKVYLRTYAQSIVSVAQIP